MKVTNDSVKNPLGALRPNQARPSQDKVSISSRETAVTPEMKSGDDVKVSVSQRARDVALAHGIARNTPDVRADRVADLKKKIASGEYKVDSDAVATRMLEEALEA